MATKEENVAVLDEPKPKAKPNVALLVGQVVHFWPPHQTERLTPADEPWAAIIAQVHEDGSANLAIMNHAGIWSSRVRVKYSKHPAMSCWTLPVK